MSIDGLKFELPPGYTEVGEWCEEHPGDELVLDNVRWVNQNVRFVFDPENPEYLEFLARCKSDSKALECALRDELRRRKVPVWVLRRPRRRYAKDYRKMSFLIRPPFFSSEKEVKKDETNRMQTSDDRDDFVLHFDRNHILQQVRWWYPKEMEMRPQYNSYMVRGTICAQLKAEASFFRESYGDWEAFAGRMCDILTPVMGKCE